MIIVKNIYKLLLSGEESNIELAKSFIFNGKHELKKSTIALLPTEKSLLEDEDHREIASLLEEDRFGILVTDRKFEYGDACSITIPTESSLSTTWPYKIPIGEVIPSIAMVYYCTDVKTPVQILEYLRENGIETITKTLVLEFKLPVGVNIAVKNILNTIKDIIQMFKTNFRDSKILSPDCEVSLEFSIYLLPEFKNEMEQLINTTDFVKELCELVEGFHKENPLQKIWFTFLRKFIPSAYFNNFKNLKRMFKNITQNVDTIIEDRLPTKQKYMIY